MSAPIKLGWTARYNEPGGFLYDTKGRFRKTAKVVIILSIIAIGLQIFWMYLLFYDIVPEAWVQNFIYIAIFFTLLTNIVAWAFVNLTWKYARDSQEALDAYSGDVQEQMRELGFTLMDLNEIGQAIKQSGLQAKDVTNAIRDMKETAKLFKESGATMRDVRYIIKRLPSLKKAMIADEQLEKKFDVFGEM